jgi:hypothetical protein
MEAAACLLRTESNTLLIITSLFTSPSDNESPVFVKWTGHTNSEFHSGKGEVPVLYFTKRHAMKAYWRSGGTARNILDLGTRWRWTSSICDEEGDLNACNSGEAQYLGTCTGSNRTV